MPQLNSTNWTDYGVIALYFVIIVCVGVFSARKSKTTAAYYRGNGRIPWPLAGLSLWVSGFSAFIFVAAAGFVYQNGVGGLLLYMVPCVCTCLITAMTFARMWRRSRIGTPLEFLTRRYSPSTTYFYSVTSILPAAVSIGQGLYIVCMFVSSILGVAEQRVAFAGFVLNGFQASVVVVGAVMVFYTAIGGVWAAVLSDAIQCVILAVMSVIVFFVTFIHLGHGSGIGAGLLRLLHEAPPNYFRLHDESASPPFLMAFVITEFLGYSVGWPLVQRLQSVDNDRSSRKMMLLCAGLSTIAPLLWFLPVMAGRVIFPNIHALWPALPVPEEASYVSLALLLLPHGMLGFVVAAILSSALGSANAAFNWLTATVAHDVYVPVRRRLMGREPTDRQQMRVAHLSMVVLGAVAVVTAWYTPRLGGAFKFMLNYGSLGMAFMFPVLFGLVFRRTPWWSGIASCATALAAASALMVLGVWKEQAYARNTLTEAGVTAVVFALSALWYRDDDPRSAGARQLTMDLKTPVMGTDQAGEPGGGALVYGLIGVLTLVFGFVLLACAFLPAGGQSSSSINLAASLCLMVIGGLMWKMAKGTPA